MSLDSVVFPLSTVLWSQDTTSNRSPYLLFVIFPSFFLSPAFWFVRQSRSIEPELTPKLLCKLDITIFQLQLPNAEITGVCFHHMEFPSNSYFKLTTTISVASINIMQTVAKIQ